MTAPRPSRTLGSRGRSFPRQPGQRYRAQGGSFLPGRGSIARLLPEREGVTVNYRANKYDENPPDDWVECGQCDCYHAPQTEHIDCRNDWNRWPFDAARRRLESGETPTIEIPTA